MNIFMTTMGKMISLFLYVIIGYILRKKEYISEEFTAGMVKVIMIVGMPALALTSFQTDVSGSLLSTGISVFVVTCGVYVLSLLLGWLSGKALGLARTAMGIWIFAVMFPNQGFMGWPIIKAMLGEEGLLLAVFGNLGFQIFVFTIGVIVTSKYGNDAGVKISMKKLFLTPVNFALVLGIFLLVTGLRLPTPVNDALSGCGGLVTPLGMMYIGAVLTKNRMRDMFGDQRVYFISFMRLVVVPLVLVFLLKPILPDGLARGVIVLGHAMPVASFCTMFAAEYGGDVLLSSKFVFVSTLLSLISIPLIVMVVTGF